MERTSATPRKDAALQHTRFASGVIDRSRAGAFFACSSRQTPVSSNGRLDQWYTSLIEPNPASIHVPSLLRPEPLRFFFALSLIIAGGAGLDDSVGGRMGKVLEARGIRPGHDQIFWRNIDENGPEVGDPPNAKLAKAEGFTSAMVSHYHQMACYMIRSRGASASWLGLHPAYWFPPPKDCLFGRMFKGAAVGSRSPPVLTIRRPDMSPLVTGSASDPIPFPPRCCRFLSVRSLQADPALHELYGIMIAHPGVAPSQALVRPDSLCKPKRDLPCSHTAAQAVPGLPVNAPYTYLTNWDSAAPTHTATFSHLHDKHRRTCHCHSQQPPDQPCCYVSSNRSIASDPVERTSYALPFLVY
jgi:hypothetical protein